VSYEPWRRSEREEGRGKKGSRARGRRRRRRKGGRLIGSAFLGPAAMASRRQTCPGAAAVRAPEQKKSGEFPFDSIPVLGGLAVPFRVRDAIHVLAFRDAESMLVHRFLD
jgi:hypothetical protein